MENQNENEMFGNVRLDVLAMESFAKHEWTRFYDKLKQVIVSRMIGIRTHKEN